MRKTSIKAFEERHPKVAIAVEQWLFAEEDRLDCKQAAARLKEKFGISQSAESLRLFWHRCSERRLLAGIADRARQASAVAQQFAANDAPTYEAMMGLIKQLAFEHATKTGKELNIETVAELVKLAISGRKEQLRAEALEFDREKYKESLRTKTDVALDAFAEFLKGQPALMEKFNALRAEVKAVMS